MTGKTSRRACAGRGRKERRSGSVREKTSWKERVGERPSSCARVDMTVGLFSRGMKALRVEGTSGLAGVVVDMMVWTVGLAAMAGA